MFNELRGCAFKLNPYPYESDATVRLEIHFPNGDTSYVEVTRERLAQLKDLFARGEEFTIADSTKSSPPVRTPEDEEDCR